MAFLRKTVKVSAQWQKSKTSDMWKGDLMLDKKLTEYAEKFNENFPIFLMMGKSDEEIIRIVQKCLNDEQAFEPDTIIDALY